MRYVFHRIVGIISSLMIWLVAPMAALASEEGVQHTAENEQAILFVVLGAILLIVITVVISIITTMVSTLATVVEDEEE